MILVFTFGNLSCAQSPDLELNASKCPFNTSGFGGRVECGFIEVNESESNDRKVKIAIARVRSRGNTTKDPIVYLSGGPGGAALTSVGLWVNHPFTQDHDMILIDQRGTGISGPLCPDLGEEFMEIIAADLTLAEEYQQLRKLASKCKDDLVSEGVDLASYNSTTNAKDIDIIRQKLGYTQWNLFGGSYGTRLGLTVMRNHPEGVRSAILAGPYPPNIHMYTSLLPNFKLSLNRVFNACKSDPNCNQRYPELEQTFYGNIAALKEKPLTFRTQSGDNFTINTQDALLLGHQMLYTRSGISRFPGFVEALKTKNAGVLEQSIIPLASRAGAIDMGMFLSVQAYDELPFNNQEDHQLSIQEHPEFSPGISFFSNDIKLQEDWHSARAPADYEQPVNSDIPTLIVSGEYDPITPPENGEITLRSLPNATHVVFPGDGHSFFTGCHGRVMTAFFEDPTAAVNSSCTSDLPKIRFR